MSKIDKNTVWKSESRARKAAQYIGGIVRETDGGWIVLGELMIGEQRRVHSKADILKQKLADKKYFWNVMRPAGYVAANNVRAKRIGGTR